MVLADLPVQKIDWFLGGAFNDRTLTLKECEWALPD
jgi:hypothetical protein